MDLACKSSWIPASARWSYYNPVNNRRILTLQINCPGSRSYCC